MRWIIGIFIISDIIYQLFGNSTSVRWWMYYDITHFGFILAICLHYLYKRGDLLMGVFGLYFGLVLFNVLNQMGLSKSDYLLNVTYSYSYFGYFTIFILITYTFYKSILKIILV